MRRLKPARCRCRRDIPDEEGTESARSQRHAQCGVVAETSPMRRGLKARIRATARADCNVAETSPMRRGLKGSHGIGASLILPGRRDIPDEEGTERHRLLPWGPAQRRRDIPDEEGTESVQAKFPCRGAFTVAETSPMKRGLKGAAHHPAGPTKRRRDIPDEEGTERTDSRTPTGCRRLSRRDIPDEEGTESAGTARGPRCAGLSRRDIPDEEGTESWRLCSKVSYWLSVAETSPMRRD